MSLCIRTISSKLTSIVGTRKAATRVNRQLPKHIERTSTFFDEFLGGGTSTKNEAWEPAISGNLVTKPLKTTSDNIVAWNYKLRSDRNWNIGKGQQDCIEDVAKNFSKCRIVYDKSAAVVSNVETDGVVRAQHASGVQNRGQQNNNPLGKPSQEQLNHVYETLRTDLPDFFIKSIDYSIYHPEIVFENNIKGTVTRGLYEYVKQTAMLRIIGHFKFGYIKFEVLKITIHPEDNSVKVRWRIRGLMGSKVIFQFWKFRIWEIKKIINSFESWHDGFSTFYVNDQGKVIRHVADKMMPDQNTEVDTKDKAGMAAKLALFVGLITPREFLTDIAPLMSSGLEAEDRNSSKSANSSVEQIQ